ncbi:MAG: M23 family metallopeptidase [Myxococcota bacterium]
MRALLRLLWLPLLFASAAHAQSDGDLYDLIDVLLPAGNALAIDGNPADWSAFPVFADLSASDLPADPGREIVSSAVAPLDQELRVLAELGGTPLAGAVYSLLFEFADGPRPDLQIVFDTTSGTHAWIAFDDLGAFAGSGGITGLTIALGTSHVEFAVPYSALTPVLPSRLVTALASAIHRSWIRARVITVVTGPSDVADFGPSMGSFRLLPTPYPLDPPHPAGLPNAGATPYQMPLPLQGEWLLGQGPGGSFTHSTSWAYDWTQLTPETFTSDPPLSPDNSDYPAFGQPLFAGVAGTVSSVVDGNPDNIPPNTANNNNEVRIDAGGGFNVQMFHQQQGSIVVSAGAPVGPNTQVGNVGNSGFSTETHLHLQVVNAGTRPLAHPDVFVRLNQGANDPWQRRLALWEPRAGFIAENAPPLLPVPGLGAIAAGLTTLALLATATRRAR